VRLEVVQEAYRKVLGASGMFAVALRVDEFPVAGLPPLL
jgi:hypothetical protein